MQTEQGRRNIKFALARKIFNPLLRNMGYTLITDHFYQPIPNPQEILTYAGKERPLSSIEWCLDKQTIAFISCANKVVRSIKCALLILNMNCLLGSFENL